MLGDELFSDLVFISKNLPHDDDYDKFIDGLKRLNTLASQAKALFSELDSVVTAGSDSDDDIVDDGYELESIQPLLLLFLTWLMTVANGQSH